jgi:uncharacterized protein (DUF1778 family)
MTRTALLIRCDSEDANRVRQEAQLAQRTISDYLLQNSILFSEFIHPVPQTRSRALPSVPRTALLMRCDVAAAERIREAAKWRGIPINAFVMSALKNAWNDSLKEK